MLNALQRFICATFHRGCFAYRPISREYRCKRCGQVFIASKEAEFFEDDRLYYGHWLDDE